MPGYPIAWDRSSPEGLSRATSCPWSVEEIRTYLDNCHHHFSISEEPTCFPAPCMTLEWEDSHSNLWLWEVSDAGGRDWWVVTGSGASPFLGEATRIIWRWQYAETKAGETGEEYLAKVLQDLPRKREGDCT